MKTIEQVKKDVFNGVFELDVERVSLLAKGTVIDANESVSWNEEAVTKRNAEIALQRQNNRKAARDLHDEMVEEIAEAVSNETSLTPNQAKLVFNRAWENAHSGGMFEVFGELEDLVNLFEEMLEVG